LSADNDPADTFDRTDSETGGSGTGSASNPSSGSSASLVGCQMGDYQILRKLGRGGMADVFAARHLTLGREVAIKVLRTEYARDADYVKRFRREARAAAKLNHPNIVQVYDVGSVGTNHFMAQELIDGMNLREELTRNGTLDESDAIEVLVGVASALQAAAESGITHRDIKPENIMRSSRGIIKVADFGLARLGPDVDSSRADLTQAGFTLGTPRYMSPEQVQGNAVDVRSDLYSLGVTMYHLLAGRPPFEADDPLALAVMHLHDRPLPLDRARGVNDLPEWLIAVVNRLMNKLPSDRFQSPTELLDAVRAEASVSLGGAYGTVGTAAATIRLQRLTDRARLRRKSKFFRVAGACLLPLACAGIAGYVAAIQPPKDIEPLLRPDHVKRAESVEQQFLVAVARDDEAGWASVSRYFPPSENSDYAAYHLKSLLHLAEVHLSEGRFGEAIAALDTVLGSVEADKIYQLLALEKKIRVYEGQSSAHLARRTRDELKRLYRELAKTNAVAVRRFESVIRRDRLAELSLQVEDS
tara:strand:+ start:46964 stop:48550 length:1587 start_codon:yes stop_codon:yes gene_type:complete